MTQIAGVTLALIDNFLSHIWLFTVKLDYFEILASGDKQLI